MESPLPIDTGVAIIGAGPAGLAVGACLRRRGVRFEIFERSGQVAPAWHRHYRRLHLHTPKESSGLPYKEFPSNHPRYPSRQQVLDYLQDYATAFELRPRFHEAVIAVRPLDDGRWEIRTSGTRCLARAVVIASGLGSERNVPVLPGEETFQGRVVHSVDYVDGGSFRDQRVLVVGFGNSGAEICLDLHEHGAKPTVSMRGPVTIIPRDLWGIPIVSVARAFSFLPANVVDFFFRPILRVAIGDLRKHGLQMPTEGPLVQVARSSRVPVLDVGTVNLIKTGRLKIRPAIKSCTERGVIFSDETSADFEAIVLATGLRPKLDFLKVEQTSGWQNQPRTIPLNGQPALPGLYFCGFHVTATGMLREIACEARHIVDHIAARER